MTRQNDVLQARAAADAWASEHGYPPSGGYSGDWYLNGYMGGWWPDGWIYWVADYSSAAGTRLHPASPIHQFSGSPIDSDVMLESEIISKEAPTVHIPADYVKKFSLVDDQDIQGLIDNFEGVVTAVRSQDQASIDAAVAAVVLSDAALVSKINQIKAILTA